MRNKPAPPAKWQIRDHLLAQLYTPVDELRAKELRALIEKNVTLLQERDLAVHKKILPEHFHRSFAYNGKFYSIEPDAGPPIRNKLHPSLEQEMRDHVEHYGRAEQEQLLIKGFFDSMLAYSPSPGDWLQILPHSLHEPLRAGVVTDNWDLRLRSQEEINAFMAKHRPRFDLIRQRMAINLIL